MSNVLSGEGIGMSVLADLSKPSTQAMISRMYDAGYSVIEFDEGMRVVIIVCSGKDQKEIRTEGPTLFDALARAYEIAFARHKAKDAA